MWFFIWDCEKSSALPRQSSQMRFHAWILQWKLWVPLSLLLLSLHFFCWHSRVCAVDMSLFWRKARQRNTALLCSRGGNIVLVGSSAAYSPAGVCCLSPLAHNPQFLLKIKIKCFESSLFSCCLHIRFMITDCFAAACTLGSWLLIV